VQADWNESKSDAFMQINLKSSYFSAIYIERFIANRAVNTFTHKRLIYT
jgi:hypothetical protein